MYRVDSHIADFSNYHLEHLAGGGGVADLAGGVIPMLAERLQVELSERPTPDELQQLTDRVRGSKVLTENIPTVVSVFGGPEESTPELAGIIRQSGIQEPLNRSLWSPDRSADMVRNVVMMGGMANWMDRMGAMLQMDAESDTSTMPRLVHVVTGNRTMNSQTEVTNTNVIHYAEEFGQPPTETQYAEHFTIPLLEKHDIDYAHQAEDTSSGGELMQAFARKNKDCISGVITVLRTANAGIIPAIQLRQVFDKASGMLPYDDPRADNGYPYQMFIMTDDFPLATTAEQYHQPQYSQKPQTALGQLVLTAKSLQQLADTLR